MPGPGKGTVNPSAMNSNPYLQGVFASIDAIVRGVWADPSTGLGEIDGNCA